VRKIAPAALVGGEASARDFAHPTVLGSLQTRTIGARVR
jgi:hypothetical protein